MLHVVYRSEYYINLRLFKFYIALMPSTTYVLNYSFKTDLVAFSKIFTTRSNSVMTIENLATIKWSGKFGEIILSNEILEDKVLA